MNKKSGISKDAADKLVRDIKRKMQMCSELGRLIVGKHWPKLVLGQLFTAAR